MKKILFLLLIIPCTSWGQIISEYLNQPVYLLDTLLYEHHAIVPANITYTLQGKYPIWNKMEFLDEVRNYPKNARIDTKTIELRHYGDGTTDTVCCGTGIYYSQTYHGNLIQTVRELDGQERPVRWDEFEMQQHIKQVKANFKFIVYYYTLEKIK